MAAQPPSYKTLASLSRMNLLYQLQSRGTMTVNDLAEAAGLHHNTAREHLDRLINDGFVTCAPEPRDSKGRPKMLYSAASGAGTELGSIRSRKIAAAQARAEQLRRMLPLLPAGQPTLAGCTGPAAQRQLDALDDHLDQAGFDASVASNGEQLHLHDCPYSEMVKDHPEVCGVHYRLIQGVLEQADGPLRAVGLNLIDAPHRCVIDVIATAVPTATVSTDHTSIPTKHY
ncbi:helix-turn-helix domain-containing protein [Cryobacterium sp. PH31-O1]|uniref:helix-turn-helix transcriptional regulator n=1 Tax=Cryobacterium sp. PH31-O1 TaxID=3046306 RepID=UPI0024B92072|nr:helix-turn-helix domain-containing protein [Cryobacterium sp. PH31-O1]MDJ0338484.1 MarR family transcriptional regulator [Cryobacterium sp. PH31-O1]